MSARADAKKKALQRAQQKRNERKLKLLNTPKTTGGRSKTTVKKGLSNIPKEGTRAGKLKMAGQGMSGLKNYKKDELKLSKAATKASEKLKKERNQKKNEGSSKSKSSATKTRSDRIKTKSGAMLKRGSVGARKAENREKARERAKAMARKRLGK